MDIKEQLDATIGQPPSSPIDIDATMTRMRRRMWTVRGTAAATTVGLVAAGAMLAWPMLARSGPTSATPAQTQAALPAAQPETEQQIADRLTVAVQAKLNALIPGTTMLPNWAGHDAAVVYPQRPVAVPTTLPWNQMRAQADVRDQLGTGFVDILIGRMTADPNATSHCLKAADITRPLANGSAGLTSDGCVGHAQVGYPLGVFASCAEYDEVLDGEDQCTEQTTAAGDHVVMLRGDNEYRVDVARADGTAVIVMSGKRAHAGGTRPSPSLTLEQMVALATDPGLGL